MPDVMWVDGPMEKNGRLFLLKEGTATPIVRASNAIPELRRIGFDADDLDAFAKYALDGWTCKECGFVREDPIFVMVASFRLDGLQFGLCCPGCSSDRVRMLWLAEEGAR